MTYQISDIKFGDIPSELYGDVASDLAYWIKEEKKERTNSETQLRRFYNEISNWHEQVSLSESPETLYLELAPLIKMIKAKVAYAHSRNSLVSQRYVDLVNHCINQVNSPKTLKQCKLFFEAFSGFYKAITAKK